MSLISFELLCSAVQRLDLVTFQLKRLVGKTDHVVTENSTIILCNQLTQAAGGRDENITLKALKTQSAKQQKLAKNY